MLYDFYELKLLISVIQKVKEHIYEIKLHCYFKVFAAG